MRQRTPPPAWLTPEADRAMNRAAMVFIGRVVLICVGICVGTLQLFIHYPALWFLHRLPVDLAAAAVIMVLALLSYAALFGRLLAVGCLLFEQRQYEPAVRALENFARFGARSFDRSGEAHYLLTASLKRLKRDAEADKPLAFLRRHRARSKWRKQADEQWPVK